MRTCCRTSHARPLSTFGKRQRTLLRNWILLVIVEHLCIFFSLCSNSVSVSVAVSPSRSSHSIKKIRVGFPSWPSELARGVDPPPYPSSGGAGKCDPAEVPDRSQGRFVLLSVAVTISPKVSSWTISVTKLIRRPLSA